MKSTEPIPLQTIGHGLVKISYDAVIPHGTHSNTVDLAPDEILSTFEVSFSRAVTVKSSNLKRVSLELEFQTLKNEVTRIGELMEHNNMSLTVSRV